MHQLILCHRRDILTCPIPLDLRHFTEVGGIWNFVRCISHPLACKCLTSKFWVVAASCSVDPVIIMSSIGWTSVISHGREWPSRYLRTELCHRAEELIHPQDKAVKVYFWSYQLKAKCFWWVSETGMEKKAFASSVPTHHVPGYVLICSSNYTASGTAPTIGVTTWLNLK